MGLFKFLKEKLFKKKDNEEEEKKAKNLCLDMIKEWKNLEKNSLPS